MRELRNNSAILELGAPWRWTIPAPLSVEHIQGASKLNGTTSGTDSSYRDKKKCL
jgi:hypothetical protein